VKVVPPAVPAVSRVLIKAKQQPIAQALLEKQALLETQAFDVMQKAAKQAFDDKQQALLEERAFDDMQKVNKQAFEDKQQALLLEKDGEVGLNLAAVMPALESVEARNSIVEALTSNHSPPRVSLDSATLRVVANVALDDHLAGIDGDDTAARNRRLQTAALKQHQLNLAHWHNVKEERAYSAAYYHQAEMKKLRKLMVVLDHEIATYDDAVTKLNVLKDNREVASWDYGEAEHAFNEKLKHAKGFSAAKCSLNNKRKFVETCREFEDPNGREMTMDDYEEANGAELPPLPKRPDF
jgi:hypothetical protein